MTPTQRIFTIRQATPAGWKTVKIMRTHPSRHVWEWYVNWRRSIIDDSHLQKDNPTAEVADFRLWSDPVKEGAEELRNRDDAIAEWEVDDVD